MVFGSKLSSLMSAPEILWGHAHDSLFCMHCKKNCRAIHRSPMRECTYMETLRFYCNFRSFTASAGGTFLLRSTIMDPSSRLQPQAPIDIETASREKVILENEEHGLGD